MSPCSDLVGGATGSEMRFKLGIIINYVIIALFLSNVVFVAYESFDDVKLSIRKRYNIYKEKQRLLKIKKKPRATKKVLEETIRKIQILDEEIQLKEEEEEEIPDEHIDKSIDEKK